MTAKKKNSLIIYLDIFNRYDYANGRGKSKTTTFGILRLVSSMFFTPTVFSDQIRTSTVIIVLYAPITHKNINKYHTF